MAEKPPPKILEDQETGQHYAILDRRRRTKYWIFTTWQWGVVGAYFVAIVLSIALGVAVANVNSNAHRLNKSICAQVLYLDGIKTDDQRSQKRIDRLVEQLRELQRCPPPPPEIPAPPG